MYDEESLLPISALQHLSFCARQCALIHIEGIWHENLLTAEGAVMHEKAHSSQNESRGDIRITRSLRVRSLRLGLIGMCDVVEFHRINDADGQSSVTLNGAKGRWIPFPVEYKRGSPKQNHCDLVQLCAQAMCIEEMLSVPVPNGALFYGERKRRTDVVFDEPLRNETERLAQQLRSLISSGETPSAERAPKCDNCSLVDSCMPDLKKKGSVANYLKTNVFLRRT